MCLITWKSFEIKFIMFTFNLIFTNIVICILQEIFNPFPTIAVWAAVKFVHKREVSQGGRMRHRYAFLPLISDPDGRDKSRLFHDLETETEVELAADAPHPPVFACVMRKQGSHSAHKQLECHGFVCNTSEDAIIIAANLYQVRKNLLP